jgi:hypothetical protein
MTSKRHLKDFDDWQCAELFKSVDFLSERFQYQNNYYGTDCTPLDCFKNHKIVTLPMEFCLNEHEMDFVHRKLFNKAQSIRNSGQTPAVLLNNYKSSLVKHNDRKRVAYDLSFDARLPIGQSRRKESKQSAQHWQSPGVDQDTIDFANIIECVIRLVISQGIIPRDSYPTSSSGVMKTMHLLVSFSGCLPQHFHYDYEPKTFDVKEDVYRGSSMFINFLKTDVTLDVGVYEGNPTKRRFIIIPAMSVVVFRGDFRHAGSANNTSKELWKYFLYLDPWDRVYGGFREAHGNVLYYDHGDLVSIADAVKV